MLLPLLYRPPLIFFSPYVRGFNHLRSGCSSEAKIREMWKKRGESQSYSSFKRNYRFKSITKGIAWITLFPLNYLVFFFLNLKPFQRQKKLKRKEGAQRQNKKIALVSTSQAKKEEAAIPFIRLSQTDPYKRGKEWGKLQKQKIQMAFRDVKHHNFHLLKGFKKSRNVWVASLPKDYQQEMKGLAKGACVGLDDVYKVHWYLDRCCSVFACSVLSQAGKKRIVATNHFDRDPFKESDLRRKKLEKAHIGASLDSKKQALASVQDTLAATAQAMIFDEKGNLHLSVAEKSAASSKYWAKFSYEQLFGKPLKKDKKKKGFTLRNLDWNDPLLAKYTTVVVSPHLQAKTGKVIQVANVAFAGCIGLLSGVNEFGVTGNTSVELMTKSSQKTKKTGASNPYLYKEMLAQSSSVKKAVQFSKDQNFKTTMNFTLGDLKKVRVLEIAPKTKAKGPMKIRRGIA